MKTKLIKHPSRECELGDNRMFKVEFEPDPDFKEFDLDMVFHVVSVNRTTGEVVFSLDRRYDETFFNQL
jgi:hypothetical protein